MKLNVLEKTMYKWTMFYYKKLTSSVSNVMKTVYNVQAFIQIVLFKVNNPFERLQMRINTPDNYYQ